MSESLAPVFKDFLICFQQSAIRETGRRPITCTRAQMDTDLLLPGCESAGYSFWQPVLWPEGGAPLGEHAASFHTSIVEYVSMCRFFEIPFTLPVPEKQSPLSYLWGRRFQTFQNTLALRPETVMDEAVALYQNSGSLFMGFPFAVTFDRGEPLTLILRASDGVMFVSRAERDNAFTSLNTTLREVMPKLRFCFDR